MPIRLGVVSFVNTLPLIDGLETLEGVELCCSVPSRLIDRLLAGEVDVALCSSIDYQRSPEPLVIVPAGLLGCDGPTLTVRLYSSCPIESIERVHCDTDSHTSIVLMQIVLRELFGRDPEIIAYHARERVARDKLSDGSIDWPEAILLIGDKVVTDSPPAVRYPHQLDLGSAWKELTGLPFVFAVWLARASADPACLETIAHVLDRQRRYNRPRVDTIIHRHTEPRHWPRDLAADYLGEKLVYAFTAERLGSLDLFFDKALSHGLIADYRPLQLVSGAGLAGNR